MQSLRWAPAPISAWNPRLHKPPSPSALSLSNTLCFSIPSFRAIPSSPPRLYRYRPQPDSENKLFALAKLVNQKRSATPTQRYFAFGYECPAKNPNAHRNPELFCILPLQRQVSQQREGEEVNEPELCLRLSQFFFHMSTRRRVRLRLLSPMIEFSHHAGSFRLQVFNF